MERLMTRKEVADLFAVTPRTILNWEREGRLTAVKINRNLVRYRREDVLKLMGNNFPGMTPGTNTKHET